MFTYSRQASSAGRLRTCNLLINNQAHYQLCYREMAAVPTLTRTSTQPKTLQRGLVVTTATNAGLVNGTGKLDLRRQGCRYYPLYRHPKSKLVMKRNIPDLLGSSVAYANCSEDWVRTNDLPVMSRSSYRCSTSQ